MIIYQERVRNYENEDETIILLIMAQEGSEAGSHYNLNTLYLQKQITSNPNNRLFSIFDELKQFIVSQGNDFYESPRFDTKDIELQDKLIKLKTTENIVLKRCYVDELGVPNLYSNTFTPKFKAYIFKHNLYFEIEIH